MYFVSVVAILTALGTSAVNAAPVGRKLSSRSLVREGKSDYVIVTAADAHPAERTAAAELQNHLREVTGAQLPIRPVADVPADVKQILVGLSPRVQERAPDVDFEAMGRDGIFMRTVGQNLLLAGGQPRGTLYAVYTFLEETVGCRWWTATESFIPKRTTLDVPDIDRTYVPKLRYREAFYRGAFSSPFAARLKCNGHFARIPAEYGGHYTILGWCHTFFQLLPPDRYFEEHPDWYSEIDDQRIAQRAQLCLTNTEMRAELVCNALAWIRKNPDAGMISISQNDWGGNCQCEKCRELEEQEGSPSGPLIHFVNAVAEEIEKQFPDFLIETLAYQYTRQAPLQVKPRRNVIIRLCSIECSFSQPLGTGPQNEKFRKNVEDWSAMAPNLYVWNYVTNFADYILPHPNLRGLAPDIRFFVDHKVMGIFEQGDSGCSCGDFVELRAWLLAHLMWDPSLNENQLIDEFLADYYGPAAPALKSYLELVHDAVESEGTYLRCYMDDTPYLTLGDMNRATELFEEAQQAVSDDPVLSSRVRRARLPVDHVWLKRYRSLKRIAGTEGKPFRGPDDPVAFCQEFIRVCEENDVGDYREGRPFADYAEMLRQRFRPAGTPPEMCRSLPEEDWVDIQDSEFRYHGLGHLVKIVDDELASDGKAARMSGNHTNWSVQYSIPADIAQSGRWSCYVVARCESTQGEGTAFTLGIYDGSSKQNIASVTETLDQTPRDEYRTYDLGVHKLTTDMYFWVTPPGNEIVKAVYVDRIFLVRAEGSP